MEALGVIETFSVASTILASDAAAKAAAVKLIELRLANGIGGKSYVTMTGTVADVTAAVDAGSEPAKAGGLLVSRVVIPQPHADLKKFMLQALSGLFLTTCCQPPNGGPSWLPSPSPSP